MLNTLFISIILAVDISYAGLRSICLEDDRELSNDKRIGRIMRENGTSGCTATLISEKCAITAGHCGRHTDYMEFDVPLSSDEGVINSALPENKFKITKILDYENLSHGNDWMVFTLGRNSISNEYPGTRRGYYEIKSSIPQAGDFISVSGYGNDSEKFKNYCQQRSWGTLIELTDNSKIYHNADTTSGSSGSAIIDYRSGKIIGIHTDGGCNYGGNRGTYIKSTKRLRSAIEECLSIP